MRLEARVLRAATRVVTVAVLATVLVCAPADAPALAQPAHVAVVVDFGGGRERTACVPWSPSGTGSAVLAAGFTVVYNRVGLVVMIDGVGDPNPPKDRYWSYWHGAGGSWAYASTGPGTYSPGAGSVEGWAYGDGRSGPAAAASYAAVCAGRDPAPTPAARPSPAPAAAARHTSRPAPGSSGPIVTSATSATSTTSTVAATRGSVHRPAGRPTSRMAAAAPAPVLPSLHLSTEPVSAQHRAVTGFPPWGTALALVVIIGLGGAAVWRARTQRR